MVAQAYEGFLRHRDHSKRWEGGLNYCYLLLFGYCKSYYIAICCALSLFYFSVYFSV